MMWHNNDAKAPDSTHQICGIVASCSQALESAMIVAERLSPYWVAFIARLSNCRPALFERTPTNERYCLVYMKNL